MSNGNGKVASARDILTAIQGTASRRYLNVDLPIAGVTVRIRSLTEGELSRYQQQMFAKKGRGFDPRAMGSANRRLFVLCVVNAAGERQFQDHDADKFAGMDAADASVLYEACSEHTGVDGSDLGELAKNSEPTPAAASPSD